MRQVVVEPCLHALKLASIHTWRRNKVGGVAKPAFALSIGIDVEYTVGNFHSLPCLCFVVLEEPHGHRNVLLDALVFIPLTCHPRDNERKKPRMNSKSPMSNGQRRREGRRQTSKREPACVVSGDLLWCDWQYADRSTGSG